MTPDTPLKARVIRPSQIAWEEAEQEDPNDTDPPGEVFTAAESHDERFGVGLWQRDIERIRFDMAFTEVCYILEGEVEITAEDGTVSVARAGDILVVPQGMKGRWTNLSPVKKVWATFEDQV